MFPAKITSFPSAPPLLASSGERSVLCATTHHPLMAKNVHLAVSAILIIGKETLPARLQAVPQLTYDDKFAACLERGLVVSLQ